MDKVIPTFNTYGEEPKNIQTNQPISEKCGNVHFGCTRPFLPHGGVTFRMDNVHQVAKRAGKKFVCTLPFRVRDGSGNLSARMKFWFNQQRELKLCLLLATEIGSPLRSKEDPCERNDMDLSISGQVYNKSRGLFCDMWIRTLTLQSSDNTLLLKNKGSCHSGLPCDGEGTSSKHKLPAFLPEDQTFYPADYLGTSGWVKDTDIVTFCTGLIDVTINTMDSNCEPRRPGKVDTAVTLDALLTHGFVCDDTLTFKWNVEII